jgi:hypothetical protein
MLAFRSMRPVTAIAPKAAVVPTAPLNAISPEPRLAVSPAVTPEAEFSVPPNETALFVVVSVMDFKSDAAA